MATLSIKPRATHDAQNASVLDHFSRRVEATPPGACPIATQVMLLETSGAQTCGKCVPCRDGIPRLASLLREVWRCEADEATLDEIRSLAELIRDTADCAIGYSSADQVLEGLEAFAEEYQSHVQDHRCTPAVKQSLPCETLCPAHVNVPAYIALVGEEDYAGAIAMIRKDNPFPTACGYVCEHPCETKCRRSILDAPLNIRGIKKYAVDQVPASEVPVPTPLPPSGRKVAVIGGGPSGMTCAYYLALMGHAVTVFEAHSQLGGMMRYGIPAYRFPRERLDEDLRAILSLDGIEVRTDTPITTEDMNRIASEYDAVFVSIGAHEGKKLRMEGIDADGVISAVELLGKIGDGDYPDLTGKKVAVIGGGNVAMDCARTAMRAGAAEVSVVYRRRQEDMTALKEEVESAIAEGVNMVTLQAPESIKVDEVGHCTALITQPQMIGTVRGGRPAPVKANKPLRRIPADVIYIAVGQDIISGPFEESGMEADRGRFCANDELQANGLDNVFVGGDCQTGPTTVIRAIAAGKVAARNIDEYLGYHHTIPFDGEVPPAHANNRVATGRVNIQERPAFERRADWSSVEEPMSFEEAMQECGRCLRCDVYGCGNQEGGRTQYV